MSIQSTKRNQKDPTVTKKKIQYSLENAQHPENMARRNLLNRLWLGLGGVALVEMIWLLSSFLMPLKSKALSSQLVNTIDAGPADQFTPGTVTAFPQGRFYLSRLEDGGFIALSRRCTHLGCTLPWDPEKGQFACPCHASVFDIRGEVLRSPAPRPLNRFAVSIVNKQVMVDTSKPIRRNAFDAVQVVYVPKRL